MSNKFQTWKNRIGFMKQYMERASSENKWERYKRFFRGDYKEELTLEAGTPVINVNHAYSYVKTDVANLYFRDPYLTVSARKNEFTNSAYIMEQALNYNWKEIKLKRQIKRALEETKIVGYSWIKLGYEAEIEEVDSDVKGETNEFIKSENLFAVHVEHNHICYDPEAVDPPYDARWMYHKYLKPTKYLKEKYGKDIKATQKFMGGSEVKENPEFDRSWVYEIWDKDTEKVYIMSDGYDKGFLDERDNPYDIEGFPFVMLNFSQVLNTGEKNNIPQAEMKYFEDQILEKIKLRSMQLAHIKRYNRQLFYDKNKIDETELYKFEKGKDGAMIAANGAPSDAVYAPPYPQIQTDIYQVENRIDSDRFIVSGQNVGEPIRTPSRTIGEVDKITEGPDSRHLEQIDRIEGFCEEISVKLVQLMQQFYDKERYAKISGEGNKSILQVLEKEKKFDGVAIKYSKEDIQGEFDMGVVMGSSVPLDKNSRVSRITQLLRFGPALGLTPDSITSKVLGQTLMKDMEMKEVEKAYNIDLIRSMQPKKPSPAEQMKMIQEKQKVDNTAADTALKKSRLESNKVSMTGRALSNVEKVDEMTKTTAEKAVTDKGQG